MVWLSFICRRALKCRQCVSDKTLIIGGRRGPEYRCRANADGSLSAERRWDTWCSQISHKSRLRCVCAALYLLKSRERLFYSAVMDHLHDFLRALNVSKPPQDYEMCYFYQTCDSFMIWGKHWHINVFINEHAMTAFIMSLYCVI